MIYDKEKQRIFDLGWFIGFWVGEGSACVGKRKFLISIAQQEEYPLKKAQEILLDYGIKSKISCKSNEVGRKSPLYSLYMNYSELDKMINLFDSVPLYSEKRERNIQYFKECWGEFKVRKKGNYKKIILDEDKLIDYYNRKFTYSKIGEIMGCSINVVERRLNEIGLGGTRGSR